MGALFAYAAAQAMTTAKRYAIVYGLMAAGGLIAVFAVGYALDAGHTLLMFRYGAATASLIVAGCLLAVAVGCIVAASVIARRPGRAPTPSSSPYSHPPRHAPYSRQRLIAAAAGFAGAATTAAALLKFKSLRDLLKGKSP